MSIRNKGNHNINVEGNDNIVKVTNCYGIDETSNIVFNFDLLNEVLDILKKKYNYFVKPFGWHNSTARYKKEK